MDTNKMREQFDAWLCNKYGHLVRPICWNGGYPSTPDGFMATEIELAWIAWQAAYAAGVEDSVTQRPTVEEVVVPTTNHADHVSHPSEVEKAHNPLWPLYVAMRDELVYVRKHAKAASEGFTTEMWKSAIKDALLAVGQPAEKADSASRAEVEWRGERLS